MIFVYDIKPLNINCNPLPSINIEIIQLYRFIQSYELFFCNIFNIQIEPFFFDF